MSREEGEIGSESKEMGDLLPCSSPLLSNKQATGLLGFSTDSLLGQQSWHPCGKSFQRVQLLQTYNEPIS